MPDFNPIKTLVIAPSHIEYIFWLQDREIPRDTPYFRYVSSPVELRAHFRSHTRIHIVGDPGWVHNKWSRGVLKHYQNKVERERVKGSCTPLLEIWITHVSDHSLRFT